MFNVAVIRLRDLLKYLLIMICIIIIIIYIKRYFNKNNLENINIGQKLSSNISKYAQDSIDIEIPGIQKIQNEQKNEKKEKKSVLIHMLDMELGALNTEKINYNEKNIENLDETIKNIPVENTKEQDIEKSSEKTNVKTEIVTKEPLADSYTKKYKSVKIKNETNFELSDDELNSDNLTIDKKNIIIFHTHTCESYTSSDKYTYTPTGKFRTTDLSYSVARVGDELTKHLEQYNINVIHDKTYHDYPAYNGSYTRSLKTVTSILKKTKADIIIDLHRDAIGSKSSYAPTVKIGDDYCAQLMFVMGSNGGGLNHPNWKTNLQFAVNLQELANNTYSGLFKPIILRNSRYNQHLGKAACIIEVGSTGNTLEQCLNSMKYLSEIINKFVQ